ncbi:MAG: peptidoglycan-binding protein [Bacteroidales bacterium]|nr:peptidoglycan-binding protein [Bacteroidales bacterium]
MKRTLLTLFSICSLTLSAQTIVHPSIGTKVFTADSSLSIELIAKKQYYDPSDEDTADKDINSPKSVNMHPNGTKYYVNSLEGATTVVYDFKTNEKLKVIHHEFTDADTVLLGNATPFYTFTHHLPDANHPASPFGGWGSFYGKPVESTFSHRGRYLWIPYYRRSYDINAQDPSAVAIIDTHTDSIIRLMDTGPLPKMIATSLDGKYVAISQWGDNTVGIINIESENPFDWHYTNMAIIDQKLKLNFSLTRQVDRDNNSGHCLRGTAFTPDNHYLLVGCMAGTGGIAVVDLHTMEYLGRITGMMPNLRHLIIRGDHLYLSINRDGYVQKIPLSTFLSTIPTLKSSANKTATLSGWQNCKVGAGARTIEMSPNNRLIFAACNNSSSLYVIDAQSMQALTSISVDSYPVGLDISADGKYVFVTSQGRSNGGGNCVDIFQVKSEEQK